MFHIRDLWVVLTGVSVPSGDPIPGLPQGFLFLFYVKEFSVVGFIDQILPSVSPDGDFYVERLCCHISPFAEARTVWRSWFVRFFAPYRCEIGVMPHLAHLLHLYGAHSPEALRDSFFPGITLRPHPSACDLFNDL